MSRQTRLSWCDVVGQHVVVRIVTAVLWAESNRRVVEQTLHSAAPGGGYFGHAVAVDSNSPVHREGGQHLHARKEQRTVRDGKEQLLQRPVDATRGIVVRRRQQAMNV